MGKRAKSLQELNRCSSGGTPSAQRPEQPLLMVIRPPQTGVPAPTHWAWVELVPYFFLSVWSEDFCVLHPKYHKRRGRRRRNHRTTNLAPMKLDSLYQQ